MKFVINTFRSNLDVYIGYYIWFLVTISFWNKLDPGWFVGSAWVLIGALSAFPITRAFGSRLSLSQAILLMLFPVLVALFVVNVHIFVWGKSPWQG